MSTVNMKRPKGKLVIIGGNEAQQENPSDESNQKVDFGNGVLEEILKQIPEEPLIEIIPFASANQEEMGKRYLGAFAKLNQKAKVMSVKERKEVDSIRNLQRLEEANIVFLTGGDQGKLSEMLHGTRFLKILLHKYENDDFILAGTSSGAMVMSEYMITSGESDEAVLKEIIQMRKGLGILKNAIIDTHFLSRGRLSRLAEALLLHKNSIGIGICEDTGVIVNEGRYLETIGSGTVVVIEGKSIRNHNYKDAKSREPIFIENLMLHILANGAGYDMEENRFMITGKTKKERKQEVES